MKIITPRLLPVPARAPAETFLKCPPRFSGRMIFCNALDSDSDDESPTIKFAYTVGKRDDNMASFGDPYKSQLVNILSKETTEQDFILSTEFIVPVGTEVKKASEWPEEDRKILYDRCKEILKWLGKDNKKIRDKLSSLKIEP